MNFPKLILNDPSECLFNELPLRRLSSVDVLLVEEDRFQAQLIEGMLFALGVRRILVIHSYPEEDIVQKLLRSPFDVVILGEYGRVNRDGDQHETGHHMNLEEVGTYGSNPHFVKRERFRESIVECRKRLLCMNLHAVTFRDLMVLMIGVERSINR